MNREPEAALFGVHPILERYRAAKVREVVDWRRLEARLDHLGAFWGTRALRDITPDTCAAYHRQRRAAGAQDSTIRGELAALRTALRWAGVSPMPPMWLPDANDRREAHLEAHELERLLDRQPGAPWWVWVFVNIAARTGARSAAIEQLTWDRVDFEAGTIDFRQPGAARTRKRRVVVPIPAKLLPVLAEARARGSGPYVLGGARRTYYFVKKMMKALGFPTYNRHTLRHTFASLTIKNGQPLAKVAQTMGCTVATLERRYVHATPEYLREVVDSI